MVKSLASTSYQIVTLDNLSEGHRDAVLAGTFVEGDLLRAADLKRKFDKYRQCSHAFRR